MATSFLSLPQELVDDIVALSITSSVSDSARRRTALACALVCRPWAAQARRSLFARLVLDESAREWTVLSRLQDQDRHMAPLVRGLQLNLDPYTNDDELLSQALPLVGTSHGHDDTGQLSNLDELTATNLQLGEPASVITAALRSPTLRVLNLHGSQYSRNYVHGTAIRALRSCARLEELRLYRLTAVPNGAPYTTPGEVDECALRLLDIRNTALDIGHALALLNVLWPSVETVLLHNLTTAVYSPHSHPVVHARACHVRHLSLKLTATAVHMPDLELERLALVLSNCPAVQNVELALVGSDDVFEPGTVASVFDAMPDSLETLSVISFIDSSAQDAIKRLVKRATKLKALMLRSIDPYPPAHRGHGDDEDVERTGARFEAMKAALDDVRGLCHERNVAFVDSPPYAFPAGGVSSLPNDILWKSR